ncbi:MAG TPA: hypothetical protein VNU71_08430, partial [Burkholderiaceae bacterium]|nr:hypothetical protein [Burkholderiaceae bacterium]
MRQTAGGARRAAAGLAALAASMASAPADAQEFGVYLACAGKLYAQGRAMPAHLDLALRRNSQLALIERSDVLPVGERMKLQISPAFYSMVYAAPLRSSTVWYDWIRGAVFVWDPDLLKLQSVRLSVDRQTAALEGEMRDGAGV